MLFGFIPNPSTHWFLEWHSLLLSSLVSQDLLVHCAPFMCPGSPSAGVSFSPSLAFILLATRYLPTILLLDGASYPMKIVSIHVDSYTLGLILYCLYLLHSHLYLCKMGIYQYHSNVINPLCTGVIDYTWGRKRENLTITEFCTPFAVKTNRKFQSKLHQICRVKLKTCNTMKCI